MNRKMIAKMHWTLLLVLSLSNLLLAQKQKKNNNPFALMEVPDSIKKPLLEITYSDYDSLSTKTELYVWNLENKSDMKYKDGIFSYRGFGPHFPRRIFIVYRGQPYILKKEGAFDFIGVLEEYIDCIQKLKLPPVYAVRYLKAISNYLEEESGETYGAEIKEY